MLCKDALEALKVLGFAFAAYKAWYGRLAQGVERAFELVVVAVVEEAQCASAAGSVVNDFGHDGVVVAKVELVAYTYFACGVDEHVPQAQLLVEFAQQEHFDACTGFLFIAVESRGEHLCVVEHEHVVGAVKAEYVFEHEVLYVACGAVEHHHAAFVAVGGRVLGYALLRELELEL